jgi:amidohydrolase
VITKEHIREQAESLQDAAVRVRRHLHKNPELSFQENQTAAYLRNQLSAIGIPYRDGLAGNGIVASVIGELPGRCVALRADIDALAVTEQNDTDYKSVNEGVMHACGHDAHTACLLAASEILYRNRISLAGSIELIFQPAEEIAPGGARTMIEQGALQPSVTHVFGQHVNTELPVGTVGFCPGLFMASADEIYITVEGRGGHAAKPHQEIDPVVIGSHLVVALQQIVSRNADPTIPSVLSFGRFIGAGAANVIPDQVRLEGTFRTIDAEWRDDALDRIDRVTQTLVSSFGGKAEVAIVRGYPPLVNDEETTLFARKRAVQYLGDDAVVDVGAAMWAEDFAYYALERPSCFYNLGVRNESRGIVHPVHTSRFDIDEDVLSIGSGLLAWIAIGALEREDD